MHHVVWDWNGTLFNDFHLLVEATSASSVAAGFQPIDGHDYRLHYVRPLRLFYERLAGRTLTHQESEAVNHSFHNEYRQLLPKAELAIDAVAALDTAAAAGLTQSVLSMWVHDELVPFVATFGIENYFTRIDGLPEIGGENKAVYLARHLDLLREQLGNLSVTDVVMIGDSVDDGVAAQEVGISCVLVTSGAHYVHDLQTVGFPVADSLVQALQLATDP